MLLLEIYIDMHIVARLFGVEKLYLASYLTIES